MEMVAGFSSALPQSQFKFIVYLILKCSFKENATFLILFCQNHNCNITNETATSFVYFAGEVADCGTSVLRVKARSHELGLGINGIVPFVQGE